MMRVTFAGVGEAFDENLANTSVLVESDIGAILLDCGFTAASAFWKVADNPLELDALYISHFHGDHYFGIPALLVRSVEEGRTKPLTIIGQAGVAERIHELVGMAYSSVMERAAFPIDYVESNPKSDFEIAGFRCRCALNDHGTSCLSVRLDHEGQSVFYSGDGRPTDQTRELAAGCDLIVHESFSLDPEKAGHGTVDSSIEFARTAGARTLALVHVQRLVRWKSEEDILSKIAKVVDLSVFLPAPGEIVDLKNM